MAIVVELKLKDSAALDVFQCRDGMIMDFLEKEMFGFATRGERVDLSNGLLITNAFAVSGGNSRQHTSWFSFVKVDRPKDFLYFLLRVRSLGPNVDDGRT
jgi:hypothetical protein